MKNGNGVHDLTFLVWKSTRQLAERFGQHRTARSQTPLIHEETREFIGEATALDVDREKLANEAVDVMVVVMGMLQLHSVGYDEFEAAILRTVEKNDGKTADTHYLDTMTGKITRREAAAG